jgi:hypothetical protein
MVPSPIRVVSKALINLKCVLDYSSIAKKGIETIFDIIKDKEDLSVCISESDRHELFEAICSIFDFSLGLGSLGEQQHVPYAILAKVIEHSQTDLFSNFKLYLRQYASSSQCNHYKLALSILESYISNKNVAWYGTTVLLSLVTDCNDISLVEVVCPIISSLIQTSVSGFYGQQKSDILLRSASALVELLGKSALMLKQNTMCEDLVKIIALAIKETSASPLNVAGGSPRFSSNALNLVSLQNAKVVASIDFNKVVGVCMKGVYGVVMNESSVTPSCISAVSFFEFLIKILESKVELSEGNVQLVCQSMGVFQKLLPKLYSEPSVQIGIDIFKRDLETLNSSSSASTRDIIKKYSEYH